MDTSLVDLPSSLAAGGEEYPTTVAAPHGVVWPAVKFLNLTNLTSENFFYLVTAPNVETLVLSGVSSSVLYEAKNH